MNAHNAGARLKLSIVLVALLGQLPPSPGRAECFRPCGVPLAQAGTAPRASDALFVLKQAVGTTTTCYDCECDVDGSGAVRSSDALRVLKLAVGIPTSLACPICTAPDQGISYERGRQSLERHDLARAVEEFQCADSVGSSTEIRAATHFFLALTGLAAYFSEDEAWNELFAQSGGTGTFDPYRYTARLLGGVVLPSIAEIREVLLGSFDEALNQALEYLAIAVANPDFVAVISQPMSPGGWLGARSSYEADATDAALISALLHAARVVSRLGVGLYDDSTFEFLTSDTYEDICDATFFSRHPSFFTVRDEEVAAEAKEEFAAALESILTALTLLEQEVDSQGNDLFVASHLPTGSYRRDPKVVLRTLIDSMAASVPLDTCRSEALSLELGRLFDDPLDRTDLPEFFIDEFDRCAVDGDTFPDLTANGLTSRVLTEDEVRTIALDQYPLCLQ